jgi:hypothetical protein
MDRAAAKYIAADAATARNKPKALRGFSGVRKPAKVE